MSEVFKDNGPNNGYMKAASELYGKVEEIFSKREVPTTDEDSAEMRILTLEGDELAFADSVFETEGLGAVDTFRISEVLEADSVDVSGKNTEPIPGSATVMITVGSGPVEYTYYIGKGDGSNISMFEKEVVANPKYATPETAEELLSAVENDGRIKQQSAANIIIGFIEDSNADIDKLSLEEQHAIESILAQLLSRA